MEGEVTRVVARREFHAFLLTAGFLAALAFLLVSPRLSEAASPPLRFPESFMWGVGGSPGFQSEMGGGDYSDKASDWWQWVHDPTNIEAGRVSGDFPEDGPGGWKTGFRADIANAKKIGIDTWRMGIEWSRIFPRSTAFVETGRTVSKGALRQLDRLANQKAVRRYSSILRKVRRAGMRPFVVINTYTLPLWIHDPMVIRERMSSRGPDDPVPDDLERGGWLSNETVTEYRKYAAYLAWKFGGAVDWWVPLNEPMVTAIYGYVNIPGLFAGNFPPGILSYSSAKFALERMAEANAVAFDEVHAKDRRDADRDGGAARVGLIHNMIHFTPSDPASATDIAATRHAEQIFNRLFPDAAIKGIFDRNGNGEVDPGERDPEMAGKADFFGLNYYFRGRVTGLGFPVSTTIPTFDFLPRIGYRWAGEPDAPPCPTICSDFGAEIDPAGLGVVLRQAASYRKPIIVTENGVADSRDALRPRFLVQHLEQVGRAARKRPYGVRVLGWFEWNLTDNYEWADGFTPRFGLHSFDPVTLERRPRRRSVSVISRITGLNGIPGSLRDRFLSP